MHKSIDKLAEEVKEIFEQDKESSENIIYFNDVDFDEDYWRLNCEG